MGRPLPLFLVTIASESVKNYFINQSEIRNLNPIGLQLLPFCPIVGEDSEEECLSFQLLSLKTIC